MKKYLTVWTSYLFLSNYFTGFMAWLWGGFTKTIKNDDLRQGI